MTVRKKEDVLRDVKRGKLRSQEIETVYDFIGAVSKKFGTFIKAVAVFGSFANKKEGADDIDIFVIVDDSFAPMDKALYIAFQSEMTILTQKYPKFHVNTVTISQFWDSARRGDPLAINVLRDGVALIDSGFFAPLKRLLIQGKIKPTEEAISATLSRAFFNINGYNNALMGAANALYWAAVEAAHAGVMRYGRIPGSPWEVASILRETLLKDKVITTSDIKVYEEVFGMEKAMSKGELKNIEPAKLKELHEKVVKFVAKIDSWVSMQGLKNAMKGGK
ncbi:MAG: nucleotidyltransferase domain-containing protein [Candidatus Altiarchaeota archaeon]|nr:nucleotidyltransferase domain-containing protein [Candidatus Altiarchaeota archaeon]